MPDQDSSISETCSIKLLRVVCAGCGDEFRDYPGKRPKYCSRQCYRNHRASASVVAARFWKKIIKTETCWLWAVEASVNGYGYFGLGHGKHILAHRFSWELKHGAVMNGLQVLHRCDVKKCVNPDHLFLGTNADNRADSVAKKRHARGETQGASKLSEKQVLEIRTRLAEAKCGTVNALASEYGVSHTTISQIKSGLKWRHVVLVST